MLTNEHRGIDSYTQGLCFISTTGIDFYTLGLNDKIA